MAMNARKLLGWGILALALPAKEFIKVDLPTLGIPTTMARSGRPTMPLLLSLSLLAAHAFST